MDKFALLRVSLFLYVLIYSQKEVGCIDNDTRLVWTTFNRAFSPVEPYISYVRGSPFQITSTNFAPVTVQKTAQNEVPYGLTFDYRRQRLFYYDVTTVKIYASSFNSSINFAPVYDGIGDSLAMALDWTTGNLYWVDGFFNWIAFKPSQGGQDAVDIIDFKVLIEDNVKQPIGIAVDPTDGLLFWSQAGTVPCIKRATLTGESVQTIASRGIYTPRGMTIDIRTKTIYWLDSFKESVELSRYDGSNRQRLRKINGASLYGINFYQGAIFLTDGADNRILILHEGTGALRQIINTGQNGRTNGIAVYSGESQPFQSDPCAENLCDHFCVVDVDGTSGRCLCQDGFQLASDEHTCSGPDTYASKLLVIATKGAVCAENVTSIRSSRFNANCFVTDASQISGLALDSTQRLIYFADKGKQTINRLQLNGIITVVVNGTQADGLCFDWLSNYLIWTDNSKGKIMAHTGITVTTLVSDPGSSLGSVTCDPYTKQIFWISGLPPVIKSTKYPGNHPVITVISSGLTQPGSLVCDPVQQLILWTDLNGIKSSAYNGSFYKTKVSTNHRDNQALDIYKDFYIWSSWTSIASYINMANTVYNRHDTILSINGDVRVLHLAVMDESRQQPTRGVCYNNGGCEHHCIPTGYTRRCECELGTTLQADAGYSCKTDQIPSDFILFGDLLAKRLYRVDRISGDITLSHVLNDTPPALAITADGSRVYWSELGQKTIVSSTLNGSDVMTVTHTGQEYAVRISIDPVTGNIFYIAENSEGASRNQSKGYVAVVSPDGTYKKTLVSGLISPRAIELHVVKGIMFYSETRGRPRIDRGNMDGTEVQTIVSEDISGPTGLAVDYKDEVLFFADFRRDVIEKCTFYGTNRQIIRHSGPYVSLLSIMLYEDTIYYTGFNLPGIKMLSKVDGSDERFLAQSPEFAEIQDLVHVTPNSKLPAGVINACSVNNGGCSRFCLPKEDGMSCACADNVDLKADGLTCEGDTKRDPGDVDPDEPLSNTIVIAAASAGSAVFLGIILIAVILLLRKRSCICVKNDSANPPTQQAQYSGTRDASNPPESFYWAVGPSDAELPPYTPYETPIYLTPMGGVPQPGSRGPDQKSGL